MHVAARVALCCTCCCVCVSLLYMLLTCGTRCWLSSNNLYMRLHRPYALFLVLSPLYTHFLVLSPLYSSGFRLVSCLLIVCRLCLPFQFGTGCITHRHQFHSHRPTFPRVFTIIFPCLALSQCQLSRRLIKARREISLYKLK